MENIVRTKSNARLKLIRHYISDKTYNWLFVPGGPGLGSESLTDLTDILNLPGNIWHFDFPEDGSNISENKSSHFSNWQKALIEATCKFDNVILVAHSSGGMFALATPEIEKNLMGLILMDSAPNSDWQKYFAQYVKENSITEAETLQKLYQENPSDDLLKCLTIACAPYFSTKKGQEKIINILKKLPFNYKSHLWTEKNFDATYKAKWIPQRIPTLIFCGDQDHITPLKLFSELSEFQRKNILIREIKNAAHFPWIDNPEDIKQIFSDYCQRVLFSSRVRPDK
jgi:pimeloyl-ACP methyl ester carboxylesterase